jgi:hypothetical protein
MVLKAIMLSDLRYRFPGEHIAVEELIDQPIDLTDDRAAGNIVTEAAALLGMTAAQLDASIWACRVRSSSIER